MWRGEAVERKGTSGRRKGKKACSKEEKK